MRADLMTSVDSDAVARLRVTLSRLARQFNASAAVAGFTPTQLSVFLSIVKYGPVGLSELARIETVNATMLSRVVGKLEAAGLVAREPDQADGRCMVVRVTPAGRQAHRRVREEKTRALASRLERLPAEQAESIINALPALEALALEMRGA